MRSALLRSLYAYGPVVGGNAVPVVGILTLGWSPAAVLLVYVAELAAVCVWTVVQVPFARKRPNNAVSESSYILGPLQAKRGSVSLPGPVPPVYPRNLPILLVVVGLSPVLVGIAFVAVALTRPTITTAVAEAFLLGGAAVFLTRGLDVWQSYFSDGGYRNHSPRSVALTPFRSLFVVGTVFVALLTAEAVGLAELLGPEQAVVALAVGKLGYEVRSRRLAADDDRRGLFRRLYGSRATEIDPEPVETPEGPPVCRITRPRWIAVIDAVAAGGRFGFGAVGIVTWLVVGLGLLASSATVVATGLALGVGFAGLRAVVRYLQFGTVRYDCYDGVLVVYDTLLETPQTRTERPAVTDATVSTGWLDRLLGTETLTVDVATGGDGGNLRLFVPEPAETDTSDDANESVSVTLPHLDNPTAITDPLGMSWHLADE